MTSGAPPSLDDDERPPPRAVIAARRFAVEVALAAFGGAVGVLLLSPVLLRAPDLTLALCMIAGLTLGCALLGVVVRLARAGRERVPPAVTVVVLALPALWLVAPVALAIVYAVPGQASGFDPFRGWGFALAVVRDAFTPRTLALSLAAGAAVPFVLVGACVAARPRTPPLALGLLGACAGYLGLVTSLGLLGDFGLRTLLDGGRQALLCGVPCSVLAMALASRRLDLEDVDRRAWRRLGLSVLAVLALIGAGARGHVRHALEAIVRRHGSWGGSVELYAGAFGRAVWLEHLDDPRTGAKLTALYALSALGGAASTATPTFLRLATEHARNDVRLAAITAVAEVSADGARYEATLPTMIDIALHDADWAVRAAAVSFLVDLNDPAAARAFADALTNARAPDARKAALFAVQEWWKAYPRDERALGPAAIFDALLRLHADASFIQADVAPRALLPFDVVPFLTRAMTDADPRVRRLAARTLRGPLAYALWRLTPEERHLAATTGPPREEW